MSIFILFYNLSYYKIGIKSTSKKPKLLVNLVYHIHFGFHGFFRNCLQNAGKMGKIRKISRGGEVYGGESLAGYHESLPLEFQRISVGAGDYFAERGPQCVFLFEEQAQTPVPEARQTGSSHQPAVRRVAGDGSDVPGGSGGQQCPRHLSLVKLSLDGLPCFAGAVCRSDRISHQDPLRPPQSRTDRRNSGAADRAAGAVPVTGSFGAALGFSGRFRAEGRGMTANFSRAE